MSSYRNLEDLVTDAQVALRDAFKSVAFEGESIGDMSLKHFVQEYSDSQRNAVASIAEYLSSASKTIEAMRSSYLPEEIFPSMYISEDEAKEAGVSNTTHISARGGNLTEKESYENAFMRMLGMPMSDDERLSGEYIPYMNKDTGAIINPGHPDQKNMHQLTSSILNERQKNILERSKRIDDAIFKRGSSQFTNSKFRWNVESLKKYSDWVNRYDEFASTYDSMTPNEAKTLDDAFAEELSNLRGDPEIVFLDDLVATPGLKGGFLDVIRSSDDASIADNVSAFVKQNNKELSVYSLHEDFYAFKELLFPIVQDGRISKCLNEPEKIVSRPFYSTSNHVNSSKIRISLLEAVIRIRLDRGSGVNLTQEALDSPGTIRPASYGVLESLIIVRLRAAIEAYAVNIRDILESLHAYSIKLRTDVEEHTNRTVQAALSDNRAPSLIFEDDALSGEFLRKNHKKTIETAILTLFGNTNKVPGLSSINGYRNGNVLDSQVGGLRTSSVVDAHLISPTLGIVGLPLKSLNDRISEILDGIERSSGPNIGAEVADIRTILGTTNGVGAIDVAVFSLALFTIKEELLLGLIPKKSYNALQESSESKYLLGNATENQPDLVAAMRHLSELVAEGYQIFVNEMSEFSYADKLSARKAQVSSEDEEAE
tara:strand:+ start:1516 stop:3483 length:1968 start_codon:yes stop_codon:yes gene_type:complete